MSAENVLNADELAIWEDVLAGRYLHHIVKKRRLKPRTVRALWLQAQSKMADAGVVQHPGLLREETPCPR